jgi:UDP-N-acetylglucosamine--N-acetylmuramyl-(pentapeptide) pyrophosphoryl-undecaprenol N-acetylglucosamine transferase
VTRTRQRIRLAIAGGGTGGHVLPALAVVNELRRRADVDALVWIGSQDGVEREAARKAGISYVAIPTGKLRRYLSMRNAIDAVRVPLGIIAARRALRRLRPDVVLSTGGFVSVPTVIAATGVAPVVTHEQTAILGLATRINARFAAILAVSHEQTLPEARKIHRHAVLTGNPIRTHLAEGNRARGLMAMGFTSGVPVVLVMGGARGASPINQRIAELLPELLEKTQVCHQTGPASANRDAAELRFRRESWPEPLRKRYQVTEFIDDELPDIYAATDVVIGRAGAGTVAELAYVGKPAILIPLPGSGGNEQAANAQVLGGAGAALVIPQPEATPSRLRSEILSLLDDPARRSQMGAAARSVAQPGAATKLAEVVLALASSQSRPNGTLLPAFTRNHRA